MAFFEKLHSKGITPSDCVPNKAFRASPWFGVFTEKDKALVSHDRMVHGIKGASTVFATDLLTGATDRFGALDKMLCPLIRPACKTFVWHRLGLLVGDEMLRFATIPLKRYNVTESISDRLLRMPEGTKADIAANAANSYAIVFLLLCLVRHMPSGEMARLFDGKLTPSVRDLDGSDAICSLAASM
jgi:hypothetical protein